MTQTQLFYFAICSLVTFWSYHTIPARIDRLTAGQASAVAKSGTFTLFVRWCGNDHLVMLVVMAMMVFQKATPFFVWAMVVHAAALAAISAFSSVIIWRAGRG